MVIDVLLGLCFHLNVGIQISIVCLSFGDDVRWILVTRKTMFERILFL